jgi:GH24 family phage-related lysozyme (muramidase)
MSYAFMQVDARTLDVIRRSGSQAMSVDAAERGVRRLIKTCLTRNQFSALVSFLVDVGAEEFMGSEVYRLTNEGKHKDAAEAFLLYAGDSPETQRRRKYERAVYSVPVVVKYKKPRKTRKK